MKRLLLFFAFAASIDIARADQFATGQAADVVLGQQDFVSGSSSSGPDRFNIPRSVTVAPGSGKVFVSDSGNNRILRFSSTAAAISGSDAEAVFGQVDFTSTAANQGGATGANTLSFPLQVLVDPNDRLWVVDSGNHRILAYPGASDSADNPNATIVFGQSLFTTAATGTGLAEMNSPAGLSVGSDDTLWVADSSNHRILRFGGVSSKLNGSAADGLFGQTGVNGTSAVLLRFPQTLSTTSDGRLWVVDSGNNRVLRFDEAATLPSGPNASGVLGQATFTTSTPATTASGLNVPRGVLAAADGTVWVVDASNNRVLAYRNAATLANGGAASVVLGQTNFTSLTQGTTDRKFAFPQEIAEDAGGRLLVTDFNNDRVLRFSPVKAPTLTITTRSGKTTSRSTVVRGGSAGEVTRIAYRVGKSGPFKNAKGTASWSFKAKLNPGKNFITVVAEGPGGSSVSKKITFKRL